MTRIPAGDTLFILFLKSPDLARKYPLIFYSRARVTTDFHAKYHGIRGLLSEHPEPTVPFNTVNAAARSIHHGDRVIVSYEEFTTQYVYPWAFIPPMQKLNGSSGN